MQIGEELGFVPTGQDCGKNREDNGNILVKWDYRSIMESHWDYHVLGTAWEYFIEVCPERMINNPHLLYGIRIGIVTT